MDPFQRAALWIEQADGLLITAGAGIGVDSGLPDFRGDEGMWQTYPSLGRQNIGFLDIANPHAFNTDPRTAWGFYGHRLTLYRCAMPHRGFDILRRWSQAKEQGSFVFTSNVDGQFQKAGFLAGNIFECHGSIHQMQCSDYCDGIWSADSFDPEIDVGNCRLVSKLPTCTQCGVTARPNIFMFGDFRWQDELYRRQQLRYQSWLDKIDKLVVIELGAGIHIPTVRLESERRAANRLIRINPLAANIPAGQGISFSHGALETLRALDASLRA